MKKYIYILLIVILAFSCNTKQAEQNSHEHELNGQPAVSHYISKPTLVIISETDSQQNAGIKLKALQYKLRIVETPAGSFKFIKESGRIVNLRLDSDKEGKKYVVFNAVNDPVVCGNANVGIILDGLFKRKITIENHNNSFNTELSNNDQPIEDILSEKPLNVDEQDTFKPLVPKRNLKKISIQYSDTITSFPPIRKIPGVDFTTQRIDSRRLLTLSFENDLITYYNTDRYFTNGITVNYQAPGLGKLLVSKLLLPYNKYAYISYKLTLVQNMYTPYTTLKNPELKKDRPYSSFLTMSLSKQVQDPSRKLILSSAIVAGYQGPESPGSYLQSYVHKTFPTNDPPLGWETQLSTTYFLNYNISAERSILNGHSLQISGIAKANAGNMYDNIGGGFKMIYGKFESQFGYTNKPQRPKFQAYLFTENMLSAVGYDATLQGGLFKKNDAAALPGNMVQRFVYNSGTGLHFAWKDFSLELCQHYVSPEFKGGKWHKWGRVSIQFPL